MQGVTKLIERERVELPRQAGARAEYPDLATMDKVTTKFLADPKYLKRASEGGTNFIARSLNDAIWRTLRVVCGTALGRGGHSGLS